ncbi:uncharacterized protein LOC143609213 [Bidens hawaiensis]|uniref:uncharacterized protein LOC143609213 n=1 Tax=Bidens hawaiensis TaxID=980011 RepID=UPI00404AE227
MKLYADSHRRDIQFQVGDWVYVKVQPYRQNSIRLKRHHKLGRRYFGPFKVVARIGPVAYKLALPIEAQIHNVFHVSMLRKCIGQPDQQITPLDLVDTNATLVLQPAVILGRCIIQRADQSITQYQVQWEGLSTSDSTWEDRDSLLQTFPDLHLEDKVVVEDGGNVVNVTTNNVVKLRRSQRERKVQIKLQE